MPRPTRPFSRRVLLSQLAVIVVTLALVTGAFAWMGARSVTEVTETKALATARALAIDPEVRKGATVASAEHASEPDDAITGPLLEITDDLRASSGIVFAVITDDRGIRLTHPDRDKIGRHVSTSPAEALAGRESVTSERGTLGETVRAKVPIYSTEDDETVVGEVSVGIHASVLDADLRREFLVLGSVAVLALTVGVIASLALGRRLRRETLGVGPEELAEMARDQGAVLRGLDDGVLAFSSSGEPTLSNSTAEQLLGIAPVGTDGGDRTDGADAADGAGGAFRASDDGEPDDAASVSTSNTEVPEQIRRMMLDAPVHGALRRRINVGDRILLATAVRVSRGGVSVGGVVTLRDETQVLTMARQLESVTSMAGALRTQRHEFANRLHTVLGLVDTGATDEAKTYLAKILRTGPIATPVEGVEVISDPYLRALLEAKGTTAAEAGVSLAVTPDSLVLGRVSDPEDVTLILGNLIDNAVRAVVTSAGGVRDDRVESTDDASGRVEVTLLGSGPELHAVVTDTGGGVADEEADEIFDEGVSTGDDLDADHGHGIGLALCRQVARRHGGRVWLLVGHDPDLGGAGFAMRLPDVLNDADEPEGGDGGRGDSRRGDGVMAGDTAEDDTVEGDTGTAEDDIAAGDTVEDGITAGDNHTDDEER